MTKEKMYLLISFLLNAVIGLCVYIQREDVAAIRREMSLTRELLEVKIESMRYRQAFYENYSSPLLYPELYYAGVYDQEKDGGDL